MGTLCSCCVPVDDNEPLLSPDRREKTENKEDDLLMDLFMWKLNNPQILKLDERSANRLLYYNEYGSKSGFPIIHFHGSASSRLEGVFLHEAALKENLRIICPDRPGTGLSTMDHNMTYKSICTDTKQLIKHLDLQENEYGISGVSQGGSHVLHHLYYLQKEIKPKLAVLISGLPPFTLIDENNTDDILSGDVKTLRNLCKNHPKVYDVYAGFSGWMLEHCWCLAESTIEKAFECESDKALLASHKQFYLKGLQYSICGEYGMDGNTLQGKNSFDDWKIDVAEIDQSIKIICFHGDLDPMIPIKWVQLLNDKMPQMELHVCNGFGHLLLLDPNVQTQIVESINHVVQPNYV